jgi:prepilin-type processing-associated H-X9-DG protein
MLLPALAASKFRTRVINCTSNYRQWGLAVNLYANDDWKGRFPRFDNGIINNTWDLDPRMIRALGPYGLTVPMWYCPVRPEEFAADDAWRRSYPPFGGGRPLTTLDDLILAVTRTYGPDDAICYHAWWVPRRGSGGLLYPVSTNYVWPTSLNDKAAALQPILTDRLATSGGSTAVPFSGGAHPYRARVRSSNLLFGDGHVETHQRELIEWRYTGVYGFGNFY